MFYLGIDNKSGPYSRICSTALGALRAMKRLQASDLGEVTAFAFNGTRVSEFDLTLLAAVETAPPANDNWCRLGSRKDVAQGFSTAEEPRREPDLKLRDGRGPRHRPADDVPSPHLHRTCRPCGPDPRDRPRSDRVRSE